MQKLNNASISGAHSIRDEVATTTSIILASNHATCQYTNGFFTPKFIKDIALHVLFALETNVPIIRIVLAHDGKDSSLGTLTKEIDKVVSFLRNYISSEANQRDSPLVYRTDASRYILGTTNAAKRSLSALIQHIEAYPLESGRLDIATVGDIAGINSNNFDLVGFSEGVIPSYSGSMVASAWNDTGRNVSRYIEDDSVVKVLEAFTNNMNATIAKNRYGLMVIPSADTESTSQLVPADALVLENQFPSPKSSQVAKAAPKATQVGIKDTSQRKVPASKVAAKTLSLTANRKPADKKAPAKKPAKAKK